MNSDLAQEAHLALTKRGFEKGLVFRQRWVRQVIQAVYGSRFDHFHAGSAIEAERLWAQSEYALSPEHTLEIGDILYKPKTAGMPDGHVGIFIGHDTVAENSSSHVSASGDARGTRTLERFGEIKLIVRMP